MKYLTKRDPFDVFDIFDRVLQPVGHTDMRTDVSETDKNYLFTMDLPGFNKEDINISVDKGYLTVCANKEETSEQTDKGYIFRERKTGSCSRSFYLGDISEDKISAKYENGTLVIDIPKQEKIETMKKIQVN